MSDKRKRFLAALAGDAVDRPPVWLMRQAGRFLPDYRAVRTQHGFWEVCKTPDLSTRVALEPLRLFGLDAAIVFSDILVVPDALGLDVTFGKGEGPQIGKPLRTRADLDQWQRKDVLERLQFLPNALRHLKEALNGAVGLVGFAGAPFTLFSYIVEGSGSDDFRKARVMLHEQPALADEALGTLADIVAELLLAEGEAGADVVQLFDTWGGLLSRAEYERYCVPALRRITDKLHARGQRVLLFVRNGQHLLPLFADTGADGFSLDWRLEWAEARAALPASILQGNLDPLMLLSGTDNVRQKTRELLQVMKQTSGYKKCIFNLGHGIVPETPVEAVSALAATVSEAAQ